MKKIRIVDACFPQGNSGACSEDNTERKPTHFEWCRERCDSLYTWFTNWTLRNPDIERYPARVAWMLEPPSLQDWPYKYIMENRKLFDAVMTYDKRLLDTDDNRFKFFPLGGSRIDWDLWKMYPKSKDVCMIASGKRDSEGHKLRHEIAKTFTWVDVYGPPYTQFRRKFDVLKEYRFCIVVESVRMDYYFSEKLIDAMSVGCVPIYWGCPSIGKWFEAGGILDFVDLEELRVILLEICEPSYEAMYNRYLDLIALNLTFAKRYRMPEDWMYNEYGFYFR